MHIDAVGVLDFKDYKIFFRKNPWTTPCHSSQRHRLYKNLTHGSFKAVREVFSFGHQRQPPALPGEKIAYGEGQSRQEKVSELE